MDTEEGVEVVWNEVQFSERKNFKLQEVCVMLVLLQEPQLVAKLTGQWNTCADCSAKWAGSAASTVVRVG